MKSLDKDRTRRYTTASEFTADIERHLGNEPVLASPPSKLYRMKKFVQRRRTLVATTAAVAAALTIGLVTSTSLYLGMRQALDTVSQLEEKAELDSKLSGCGTGAGLAKDRAAAALTKVEIPEEADY